MKTNMIRALAAITILAVFGSAYAADNPPPQFPGPYPVELKVGELFVVGKSIEIVQPVRFPICDDIKIVNVVDTPDGLAFKGISPGKTLCSVAGGSSMTGGTGPRRVFAITVSE